MRRHHFGRWRRAATRTPGTRFHHADRLSGTYLPDASHIGRGLR